MRIATDVSGVNRRLVLKRLRIRCLALLDDLEPLRAFRDATVLRRTAARAAYEEIMDENGSKDVRKHRLTIFKRY